MLALPVRGCPPLRPDFPDGSGCLAFATGLVRVRSPLLAESRLMSFPPGTEMFQFPGFASRTYGFSPGSSSRRGLPHSDICGSPGARPSPQLFAACHVLHRLSVPRHPPDALQTLAPLLARSLSSPKRAPRAGTSPATLIVEYPGPAPIDPDRRDPWTPGSVTPYSLFKEPAPPTKAGDANLVFSWTYYQPHQPR